MSPLFSSLEIPRPDPSLSAYSTARATTEGSPAQSRRAARDRRVLAGQPYLCVVMPYLKTNPLLREPLSLEHIKVGTQSHRQCRELGQALK
jgi:xylulose-5-phosphate/fructose-6-phosphate phosphoketolase